MEKIKEEINNIIKSLYLKSGKANRKKLIEADLDDEPINWGDLKCYEVKETTLYIAFIDEASPTAYKFRDYIKEEMAEKGYEVEVITEW